MPESQNPQNDKAKKPRPFGSFLLFLMVLVVILLAFGSNQLTGPTQLTQDQFEWSLYTGKVARLDIRGQNEVGGELKDKSPFVVSFSSLATFLRTSASRPEIHLLPFE